jgi:hypothetical protein
MLTHRRADKQTNKTKLIFRFQKSFYIVMKHEISREIFEISPNNSLWVVSYGETKRERGTELWIEFHVFDSPLQMRYTFTEDLRNFWPSYRQWGRYYITVCQVNTAKHKAHWLKQMLRVRKVPISNTTLKVNYSESHCGTVCLHFLIRHHNYLSDTSNLLQATERTVIWWIHWA